MTMTQFTVGSTFRIRSQDNIRHLILSLRILRGNGSASFLKLPTTMSLSTIVFRASTASNRVFAKGLQKSARCLFMMAVSHDDNLCASPIARFTEASQGAQTLSNATRLNRNNTAQCIETIPRYICRSHILCLGVETISGCEFSQRLAAEC